MRLSKKLFHSLLLGQKKEKRRLQMLTLVSVTERITYQIIVLEYQINDALRKKKRARFLLKSNEDAYEE